MCHSDESSAVDLTRHTCTVINGESHAPRVWNMITVDEQLNAMRMSELSDAYRSPDPEFKLPSRSFISIIKTDAHAFPSLCSNHT